MHFRPTGSVSRAANPRFITAVAGLRPLIAREFQLQMDAAGATESKSNSELPYDDAQFSMPIGESDSKEAMDEPKASVEAHTSASLTINEASFSDSSLSDGASIPATLGTDAAGEFARTGELVSADPFNFSLVDDFGLSILADPKGKDLWKKWGLAPNTVAYRFSFAERFENDAEGVFSSKKAAAAVSAGGVAALGGIELMDSREETTGKAATFLLALFRSPALREVLRVPAGKSSAGAGGSSAGAPLTGAAGGVRFERLRCTETSMAFFDRCQELGLVYEDGAVARCMP